MSSRRSSHRHSVIDPSLSKSMDSTSSETKRTKRRITQVDPNVKIADITRPTRSYPKKTVPNRSEVFNFQCEGDLPSSTEENKLHVKWQAKFDRPIEQLIYPSLQRFDNEGYEKKKKLYRQLHGSNDFVATSKTTGQPFTSNLAADGIKLDFLPAAEHMSPNIMFLHTPKWSVDITSITIVDPNANSAQTSPIKIDRPSSAKASKKNSRKDYDDDDFSDISDAFEHIIMPTFKHNNLEDEIELEGEVFLREKLRENLRLKLEEEERVKREEEEAKNPFNVTLMKSRKALTRSLPPIDDGDRLYSTLKGRRATSGNGPVAKLTDLSVEENAFLTETKVIKSMASKDNSHLLDGVLYFRVKNQIHKAQEVENKIIDEKRMETYHAKSESRKYSNLFSRRLSSKPVSGSTVSEMHALRNEDPNMVTASILHELPEIQEMHLSRVQRAIASQLTGFASVIQPKPITHNTSNGGSSSAGTRYSDEDYQAAERSKRIAQDQLLLQQLDKGVLPESFIKSNATARSITINLSRYGIGDVRGVCLGKCLSTLDRLESLGLSDNRLTANSIPTIMENLHPESLLDLDLSFNDLHDKAMKSVANHFRFNDNVLRYMDLSNSGLKCVDVKVLCNNLKVFPNGLEEMYLAGNKIAGEGAMEICSYLSSRTCVLKALDLSWNIIGEAGAYEFAGALRHNDSLQRLNLSANGINDAGGQRLADSIQYHKLIEEINLAQNSVSNCTCFVVSKVLKDHPSMRKLDLSLNPLGEAGARSIFRTILRGLVCFVTMRNCSYGDDDSIYNHHYPSLANPYVLDLSEPYKRAVFQELIQKFLEDPSHCYFENLTFQESLKSPTNGVQLTVNAKQEVTLKSTGDKYVVPNEGWIRFNFQQEIFVPSLEHRISQKSLTILQIIIENGITEIDKRMWLTLLSQDVYFTTEQANSIIARFKKNKTIGAGGLSVLDILISLWKYLLDTENMFDFLYQHTDINQRKDLVYALTLNRYKFNWLNPTSFWRLNLADKAQRSIMLQLIAINNCESEYSKGQSGRQDTSQSGNWYNFRNEKYTVDKMTREMTIDKDFLRSLPNIGTIEFDYVSTTRPPGFFFSNNVNTNDLVFGVESNKKHQKMLKEGSNAVAEPVVSGNAAPVIPQNYVMSPLLRKVPLVSDEEFYNFMKQLGLSNRSKVSNAQALFLLMDLQLAVTKYYFHCMHVQLLLDAFEDDWEIQSKVIVIMFTRLRDLHNIDLVLRNLDAKAQQEVMKRLGCLNLINPLKISSDYVLCLKYQDNRVLLVSLMELASIETADNIVEDMTTELPIAALYGSYTRALNDVRPEIMRFTYCDFGVRTTSVNWSSRKDLLKKFLVGTAPMDEQMFRMIGIYKEMEAANSLGSGPIDLQYANYLKQMKSNGNRVMKNNKSMINVMKAASAGNAPIVDTSATTSKGATGAATPTTPSNKKDSNK